MVTSHQGDFWPQHLSESPMLPPDVVWEARERRSRELRKNEKFQILLLHGEPFLPGENDE